MTASPNSPARRSVYESEDDAVERFLAAREVEGDTVVIRYRRAERAEDAGNALSDQFPEVDGAGQKPARSSPMGVFRR